VALCSGMAAFLLMRLRALAALPFNAHRLAEPLISQTMWFIWGVALVAAFIPLCAYGALIWRQLRGCKRSRMTRADITRAQAAVTAPWRIVAGLVGASGGAGLAIAGFFGWPVGPSVGTIGVNVVQLIFAIYLFVYAARIIRAKTRVSRR
jgi:beta-lactamase regulating signal transducer with metallopeptidase domain